MPWAALAIGAGIGLLKSQMVDAPKAERERALASATQRYSPWTHLQANPIHEADPFSSALQFGATGAMIGAGAKESELQEAMTKRLNKGGSLTSNLTGVLGDEGGSADPMKALSPGNLNEEFTGPRSFYNGIYGGWNPMSAQGNYYWHSGSKQLSPGNLTEMFHAPGAWSYPAAE